MVRATDHLRVAPKIAAGLGFATWRLPEERIPGGCRFFDEAAEDRSALDSLMGQVGDTVASCSSTSSSAFLDAVERPSSAGQRPETSHLCRARRTGPRRADDLRLRVSGLPGATPGSPRWVAGGGELERRQRQDLLPVDCDLAGPDREHAEVSMLALHLLQSALVQFNTLLLQAVLEVPEFHDSIGPDERRALTPLFWTHINPYGRFRLNMDTHLDLDGSTGTDPSRIGLVAGQPFSVGDRLSDVQQAFPAERQPLTSVDHRVPWRPGAQPPSSSIGSTSGSRQNRSGVGVEVAAYPADVPIG